MSRKIALMIGAVLFFIESIHGASNRGSGIRKPTKRSSLGSSGAARSGPGRLSMPSAHKLFSPIRRGDRLSAANQAQSSPNVAAKIQKLQANINRNEKYVETVLLEQIKKSQEELSKVDPSDPNAEETKKVIEKNIETDLMLVKFSNGQIEQGRRSISRLQGGGDATQSVASRIPEPRASFAAARSEKSLPTVIPEKQEDEVLRAGDLVPQVEVKEPVEPELAVASNAPQEVIAGDKEPSVEPKTATARSMSREDFIAGLRKDLEKYQDELDQNEREMTAALSLSTQDQSAIVESGLSDVDTSMISPLENVKLISNSHDVRIEALHKKSNELMEMTATLGLRIKEFDRDEAIYKGKLKAGGLWGKLNKVDEDYDLYRATLKNRQRVLGGLDGPKEKSEEEKAKIAEMYRVIEKENQDLSNMGPDSSMLGASMLDGSLQVLPLHTQKTLVDIGLYHTEDLNFDDLSMIMAGDDALATDVEKETLTAMGEANRVSSPQSEEGAARSEAVMSSPARSVRPPVIITIEEPSEDSSTEVSEDAVPDDEIAAQQEPLTLKMTPSSSRSSSAQHTPSAVSKDNRLSPLTAFRSSSLKNQAEVIDLGGRRINELNEKIKKCDEEIMSCVEKRSKSNRSFSFLSNNPSYQSALGGAIHMSEILKSSYRNEINALRDRMDEINRNGGLRSPIFDGHNNITTSPGSSSVVSYDDLLQISTDSDDLGAKDPAARANQRISTPYLPIEPIARDSTSDREAEKKLPAPLSIDDESPASTQTTPQIPLTASAEESASKVASCVQEMILAKQKLASESNLNKSTTGGVSLEKGPATTSATTNDHSVDKPCETLVKEIENFAEYLKNTNYCPAAPVLSTMLERLNRFRIFGGLTAHTESVRHDVVEEAKMLARNDTSLGTESANNGGEKVGDSTNAVAVYTKTPHLGQSDVEEVERAVEEDNRTVEITVDNSYRKYYGDRLREAMKDRDLSNQLRKMLIDARNNPDSQMNDVRFRKMMSLIDRVRDNNNDQSLIPKSQEVSAAAFVPEPNRIESNSGMVDLPPVPEIARSPRRSGMHPRDSSLSSQSLGIKLLPRTSMATIPPPSYFDLPLMEKSTTASDEIAITVSGANTDVASNSPLPITTTEVSSQSGRIGEMDAVVSGKKPGIADAQTQLSTGGKTIILDIKVNLYREGRRRANPSMDSSEYDTDTDSSSEEPERSCVGSIKVTHLPGTVESSV